MFTGSSSDIVSHMSESESDCSPSHNKSNIRRQLPVPAQLDILLHYPAPPKQIISSAFHKKGAITAR